MLLKKNVIKNLNIMKTITTVLFILTATYVSCQSISNIITFEEYEGIQINGLTLADLRKTEGDITKLEAYFGNPLESNINDKIGIRGYTFDGFEVGFREGLGGFDITNNNISITIKGITFSIGDNISVLGSDIVFNISKDGSKSILYQFCYGCNNYIGIYFDQETKLITAIYYIELT